MRANEYVFELISGMMDASDTSPEQACKRELAEEIGYTGGKLFRTGVSYANPAMQTNKIYSFITVGGTCKDDLMVAEVGADLHPQKLPFAELVQSMSVSGQSETYQSHHLANLFLASAFIRSSNDPALKKLQKYMLS